MPFGRTKAKHEDPRPDPYNLKPKTFHPRQGCEWPLHSASGRLVELDAAAGLAHLTGHAVTSHARTCDRAGERCRLTDRQVTLCAGHAKRLREHGVTITRGAA